MSCLSISLTAPLFLQGKEFVWRVGLSCFMWLSPWLKQKVCQKNLEKFSFLVVSLPQEQATSQFAFISQILQSIPFINHSCPLILLFNSNQVPKVIELIIIPISKLHKDSRHMERTMVTCTCMDNLSPLCKGTCWY